MQVIADTSAGGRLGAALGTGLQQLAQNKLENIQRQHQTHGFTQLFGPQVANLLSNANPEVQKALLQNPDALNQLGALLGGAQASGNTGGAGVSALGTEPGATQESQSQQPTYEDEKRRLVSEALTPPREKREREKLAIKKEEHELKGNKDVREYLAPYNKQVEASEDNIRDYNLLENLAKKGDLRSGRSYQLLSKLGLEDFGANYSTQLANKLIGRLAQNAQSAFGPGTRVTNYLERVFQRSLPSLWNTPEGIIGISKLNKLQDQVNLDAFELRRKIIQENKGKVPGDVEGIVRERMRPIRERLENQAMDIITGLDTSKRGNELRPKGYKGRVLDNKTGKIIEV